MGLLRIIWEDILWLNSRSPIVKFIACATAIFLLWGAWYLGTGWWTTEAYLVRSGRPAPRWEKPLVFFGIALLLYIISLIERYRRIR